MKFATIAIVIADGTEDGDMVSTRMWAAPLAAAENLAIALTARAGEPVEGLMPLPPQDVVDRVLRERKGIIIDPRENP